MDADQNFKFSQPTEIIAFNDSLVIPSMEERTRQDTLWKDSLTIDTVMERRYTHFLPDDVLLRQFQAEVFFAAPYEDGTPYTGEVFFLFYSSG
mgnify:CR=1 FL=1